MALVKKGVGSKQITRLIIILLVVAIGGGIVYWIINQEPALTLDSGPIKKDLAIIKDAGFDLLTNEAFINLTQHGDLPVEAGTVGRPNPFTTFVK